VDLAQLIDPRGGPISNERAEQLRARLVEHARQADGSGCITCGPGHCLTRADAIGTLIGAGRDRSHSPTATGVDVIHPWAQRPYDQVIPGLWQGGHFCAPATGQTGNDETDQTPVILGADWDLVVSLHSAPGHGPPGGERELLHLVDDDELDDDEMTGVLALVAPVVETVRAGGRVLVRCQVGYNRSGLVVGLVLLELGYSASAAIRLIRQARGEFALFNVHFLLALATRAVELGRSVY
jgi:hypothetical protein